MAEAVKEYAVTTTKPGTPVDVVKASSPLAALKKSSYLQDGEELISIKERGDDERVYICNVLRKGRVGYIVEVLVIRLGEEVQSMR